jgi:hypothetical protein
MGIGASVSSNVAAAVADAYTSVLNSTNTSFDQEIGQTETIGFNNCDTFIGGDANISQSETLSASLKVTANVTDTTNIANDIAQVLTQSAQSSVGEMVIGYAAASNVASTYASMNTNISNYVTQSATVTTNTEQSFACNNSTITVKGDLNLSQIQTSDIADTMDTTVVNSSTVENVISQSIEQTASASTGMDMWSFLILGIFAIVGIVIFKILEARARNRALNDSGTENCVMEMARSQSSKKLQGGSWNRSLFSGRFQGGDYMSAQASCPTCVDRCIDVNQSSHLYIHLWWVIVWIVILIGFGSLVGAWYGIVASRGCIHSESCSSTSSSSWASGCSCDMDNVLYQSSVTCKSPVTETVTSLGVPIKYQYPLLHSMTSGATATTSDSVGAASLQGMIVSSFKLGQTEYNSNNGNNLFTLLTYENLWYNGNTAVQIQSLFEAAASYIEGRYGQTDGFTNLYQVITASGTTATSATKAHLLFQYMNPLRLEYADTSKSYLEPTTTGLSIQTMSDVSGSQVFPVPPQFRFNTVDTTSLGSCSITTMTYVSSGGTPFTTTYDAGDASFCTDNSRMMYPTGSDASYVLTLSNTSGNATSQTFAVDDLLTLMAGNFNNLEQEYTFYDSVSSSNGGPSAYTPLDVYCKWADITSNNLHDYGMMRLLWAGVLSTQVNMGASQSLWGVNTSMTVPNYTTYDYAYTGGQVYNEFGLPSSGIPPDSMPTTLISVQADSGVSEGGYEVSEGFAMAALGSTATLSGQGFTATSAGLGYCRDWFYNESTLTALWVVLVFWLLLFPGYIAIRAYVGESQTKANDRASELRSGGRSNNQSNKQSKKQSGNQMNGGTNYYLDTRATNPFKACSKNGSGRSYSSINACRAAFEDR